MTSPLFDPIQVGPLRIKNRIVLPSHGTGLSDDRELRYLHERAAGGAGFIGVEAALGVESFGVGPSLTSETPDWDQTLPSPTRAEGVAYFDSVATDRFRLRADVIHGAGAHCFGQIYHLGSGRHTQTLRPGIGPSPVPDPYEGNVPHTLSEPEIEELAIVYAHGVRRVKEAGLDAVEIHAAHGYLLNQFLSPYFNIRSDRWGGSTRNRTRILRRILELARQFVGTDFPIGVRIGVDGPPGGITLTELSRIAGMLSDRVEFLSVSGGNYVGAGGGDGLAYVSPWYRGSAYNLEAARAVSAVVDVPVIVTGGISDPAVAEAILTEGSADMVGMVRALIADPDLPNKVERGAAGAVRRCLGVSECHHAGGKRVPLTCAVNASAGREAALVPQRTRRVRRVVVVGAGPAGLEAARVAAERGHVVHLFETSSAIGGTVRLLARDPNRRNLGHHAEFFESEFRRLGVQVTLSTQVTADAIRELDAGVVVVATGGRPVRPAVGGITEANVMQAVDVLRGEAEAGDRALVVGGVDPHLGGPTVAEFLADRGVDVECISEQVDFARAAEEGTRYALGARLARKGVRVTQHQRLSHVSGGHATVVDTLTGATRTVENVTVILACGLLPDDRLARSLSGAGLEVHVVGDAFAPRRIMHANADGALVGARI